MFGGPSGGYQLHLARVSYESRSPSRDYIRNTGNELASRLRCAIVGVRHGANQNTRGGSTCLIS